MIFAVVVAGVVTAASLQADTQALLKQWAEAQHQGDAKTYLSFYDTKKFHGTKRTTSGEKKNYNFTTWAADRTKLLKNKPEVAVEDVHIDTWLDRHHPKTLKAGLIHVRFLQRWRSPHYADHGPKIMQLYRGSDGKLHISYEALLQSRPGWDRPPKVAVAMAVPRSDDEAMALWRKINPVGKSWEQAIGSIDVEPKLRRALARALIGTVDFQCKNIVNEGQCGEDDFRWGPLPDAADLDDPCLARNLAEWALNDSELTAADLRKLWPSLTPVFGWGEPDEKLCVGVLSASAPDEELHAEAIATAIDKKCGAKTAVAEVAKLSEKARVKLAGLGVETAFDGLDVKKYAQLFLDALDAGDVDFRIGLIERLVKAGGTDKLKAKLRTVTDDSDERLSAIAADALADLGDTSRLPRRPPAAAEGTIERELRRLYFDPDHERAAKRLRAFMPKKGKFKTVTTTTIEYDGNTPPEERADPSEDTDEIDFDDVRLKSLSDWIEPSADASVSLVWDTQDGKRYLVGIEIEIKRFVGCPC